MPAKELQKNADWIESCAILAKEHDIPFFVFIAPDKETVYPEYLPPSVRPAEVGYYTPLFDEIKRRGIPFFHALDSLNHHKSDGILYYRTDTHWNALGGKVALEGFLSFLRMHGIDIVESIPNLKLEPGPSFAGDLIGNGGFFWSELRTDDNFIITGLPDANQTSRNNTYISQNAASNLHIWLFHDSFFGAISPYFSALFPMVTYTHHHDIADQMPKMLASDTEPKPDIIVLKILERPL